MHIDSGGSGEPTLVLLHGLGANAGVWQNLLPLIEKHWPGRWMAPDLPGHGQLAGRVHL
jgi:pimeloyl-ACP methyl ester carboxylesterase